MFCEISARRFFPFCFRGRRGGLPEFSHDCDKGQAAEQVKYLDELAIADLESLYVLVFMTINFFQALSHHFLHYLATYLYLVSHVLWCQLVHVLKKFLVLLFDFMFCILHLLSQANT